MQPSKFNFDPIATAYDSWYDSPVGQVYDIQEKRAVSSLLPPAGDSSTLLEVGSGTGHWSAWFAEKGYQVTGIDVSSAMVTVAEGKGLQNVQFIAGDFMTAAFDGDFDVVAAITTLEFIPGYSGALDKMRSLINPGGCMIIGVLNRISWLGVSRKIKGAADPVFHNARFFTVGEIKRLLNRYGKARVIGSTFALPYLPLLRCAGMLESLGKTLCPCWGNFIVGRVEV